MYCFIASGRDMVARSMKAEFDRIQLGTMMEEIIRDDFVGELQKRKKKAKGKDKKSKIQMKIEEWGEFTNYVGKETYKDSTGKRHTRDVLVRGKRVTELNRRAYMMVRKVGFRFSNYAGLSMDVIEDTIQQVALDILKEQERDTSLLKMDPMSTGVDEFLKLYTVVIARRATDELRRKYRQKKKPVPIYLEDMGLDEADGLSHEERIPAIQSLSIFDVEYIKKHKQDIYRHIVTRTKKPTSKLLKNLVPDLVKTWFKVMAKKKDYSAVQFKHVLAEVRKLKAYKKTKTQKELHEITAYLYWKDIQEATVSYWKKTLKVRIPHHIEQYILHPGDYKSRIKKMQNQQFSMRGLRKLTETGGDFWKKTEEWETKNERRSSVETCTIRDIILANILFEDVKKEQDALVAREISKVAGLILE